MPPRRRVFSADQYELLVGGPNDETVIVPVKPTPPPLRLLVEGETPKPFPDLPPVRYAREPSFAILLVLLPLVGILIGILIGVSLP